MSIFNNTFNALKEFGSTHYGVQFVRCADALSAQRAHVYIPTLTSPTAQDEYVRLFLNSATAPAAATRIEAAIIADVHSVDSADVTILTKLGASHIAFGQVEAVIEVSRIGTASSTVTRTVVADHQFVAHADL